MSSPNVIIPACNEESTLGRTLRALPKSCNPIVAVNGSTDGTARVAKNFGAEIYEYEIAGKDDAFRKTLRNLGNRASEPFLITDADSVPAMPIAWVKSMIEMINSYDDDQSIAVAGLLGCRPTWASYPVSLATSIRTVRMTARQHSLYSTGSYLPCGANSGFRLEANTLEALIDGKERYWPGEDQYYFDLVRDMGGLNIQNPDPRSLVLQSSRYHVPLTTRLVIGKAESLDRSSEEYLQRGLSQPGTKPYESKYKTW